MSSLPFNETLMYQPIANFKLFLSSHPISTAYGCPTLHIKPCNSSVQSFLIPQSTCTLPSTSIPWSKLLRLWVLPPNAWLLPLLQEPLPLPLRLLRQLQRQSQPLPQRQSQHQSQPLPQRLPQRQSEVPMATSPAVRLEYDTNAYHANHIYQPFSSAHLA